MTYDQFTAAVDPRQLFSALVTLVRAVDAEDNAAGVQMACELGLIGAGIPPRDLSPLTAAAYAVAILHVGMGLPLALPATVREFYKLHGVSGFEMTDCERCGYHLPASFSTCPLCGGRCAPGAFARRCATAALSN